MPQHSSESFECSTAGIVALASIGYTNRPDEKWVPNFSMLQEAFGSGRISGLFSLSFDLLHSDGEDLIKLPLVERKAALKKVAWTRRYRLEVSGRVVRAGF